MRGKAAADRRSHLPADATAPSTPDPIGPGSYLLLIRTDRRLELAVGRLGVRVFPRGWHVYAGSARGGLAARLRHHLEPDRPVHWHVDVLRQAGHLAAIWAVEGRDRHECALARAVAALPGARLSPNFGSSDCRCPGHLLSFARRPPLNAVWPGLARLPLASLPCGVNSQVMASGKQVTGL